MHLEGSVKNLILKNSGSGKIYINCKNELSVKLNGSRDIYYTGNPSEIKNIISG